MQKGICTSSGTVWFVRKARARVYGRVNKLFSTCRSASLVMGVFRSTRYVTHLTLSLSKTFLTRKRQTDEKVHV